MADHILNKNGLSHLIESVQSFVDDQVPKNTSELTNDSGFLIDSDLDELRVKSTTNANAIENIQNQIPYYTLLSDGFCKTTLAGNKDKYYADPNLFDGIYTLEHYNKRAQGVVFTINLLHYTSFSFYIANNAMAYHLDADYQYEAKPYAEGSELLPATDPVVVTYDFLDRNFTKVTYKIKSPGKHYIQVVCQEGGFIVIPRVLKTDVEIKSISADKIRELFHPTPSQKPEKKDKLDYVFSIIPNSVYIRSGLYTLPNSGVYFKGSISREFSNYTQFPIGSHDSSSPSDSRFFIGFSNTYNGIRACWNGAAVLTSTIETNKWYEMSMNLRGDGQIRLICPDTSTYTRTTSGSLNCSNHREIFLFAYNLQDSRSHGALCGKISEFIVSEGTEVVGHFLPKRDEDGTVGFYDNVHKTFVTPSQGQLFGGYSDDPEATIKLFIEDLKEGRGSIYLPSDLLEALTDEQRSQITNKGYTIA